MDLNNNIDLTRLAFTISDKAKPLSDRVIEPLYQLKITNQVPVSSNLKIPKF